MNVKNVEKKEKSTAEITVEVSAERFEKAIDAAYKKNRSQIAIPGFRKGKAPRKIIENQFGASIFFEDAIEIVAPEAITFAANDKELDIVGRPSIIDVDVSAEKVLTLKYLVALYPEVTVGEYKGLSAPKTTVKVLKKEIDEEVENIRKRNARIQEVERAAKSGDTANINFEGFVDGVAFDGGKGENYDLVLGSGTFIPGFEDQVIGMAAGEEKDVNVTFPEQYAPELAGKDATFKVKVNIVKESILPELDDEFAKDVSEFDTLEEYKASVKEQISDRKKAEAESEYKTAIMEKLTDITEAEIPDEMIDERVEYVIRDYENNLQAQGANLDMYLQMMGMERSAFEATLRPTAEKNIRLDLAVTKIAELENVEVSDEDCEAELKKMAEQYGMDIEMLKKYITTDALRAQLKSQKVEDIVMGAAKVEKKTTKKKEADAAEDSTKE